MKHEIEIEGKHYEMRLAEEKEIPQLCLTFPNFNEVACSSFILFREGKIVGVMEAESMLFVRQIWLTKNQGAAVRTHFTAFGLFLQQMAKKTGATIVGFVFKNKRTVQKIFEDLGAKKFRPSKGRFYSYPEKVL
jgi:hypothetical protein